MRNTTKIKQIFQYQIHKTDIHDKTRGYTHTRLRSDHHWITRPSLYRGAHAWDS